MPGYSRGFYQPGTAIRLGKLRVVKNELVARLAEFRTHDMCLRRAALGT